MDFHASPLKEYCLKAFCSFLAAAGSLTVAILEPTCGYAGHKKCYTDCFGVPGVHFLIWVVPSIGPGAIVACHVLRLTSEERGLVMSSKHIFGLNCPNRHALNMFRPTRTYPYNHHHLIIIIIIVITVIITSVNPCGMGVITLSCLYMGPKVHHLLRQICYMV